MSKLILTALALFAAYILLLSVGMFDKTFTFPGTHTNFTYGATGMLFVLYLSTRVKANG